MSTEPAETLLPQRTAERVLRLAREWRDHGATRDAALLYATVADVEPAGGEASTALAELGRPGRPPLPRRAARRLLREGLAAIDGRARIWKYRTLSTCRDVRGTPRVIQPVLFLGQGRIVLGEDVQFGWRASPEFHTGYSHIEAAAPGAVVEFGDRFELNNSAFVKSEGAGIVLGADGLFGARVEIFDSDFHDLHPERRVGGRPKMAPVVVGPNVFVGMGVRILKGVTIGADSVIGAGSVVSGAIPAGVVAAGNPARVVRSL